MLLEEPIDHTCAAGGRRKEGRKGEAVMRGKSGGGRGREVSHEFTAWLNIVNYWLARAMTDSYSREGGNSESQEGAWYGWAGSRLFHHIPPYNTWHLNGRSRVCHPHL